MMAFRNMRVSMKLGASFGVLLLIAAAIGMLSVGRLSTVANQSSEISEHWMPSLHQLAEINTALSNLRVGQLNFVDAHDATESAAPLAAMQDALTRIEKGSAAYLQLIQTDEEREHWERIAGHLRAYRALHDQMLQLWKDGNADGAESLVTTNGQQLWDAAGDSVQQLIEIENERSLASTREAHALYASGRTLIFLMIALATLAGATLAFLVARAISKPIGGAIEIFGRIAQGRLDNEIDTTRRDEIGDLLANLSEMQAKLRAQIETERAQATENSQIRAALDCVSAGVMVADPDLKIVYTNPAVEAILRTAEADIRKDLPSFSAANLRGASLSVFDKNTGEQHALLGDLRSSRTHHMQLGGRAFRMIASPVLNSSGGRAGTVVEWKDRTPEVSVEKELEGMLSAVNSGDLQRRIELSGKNGFFEAMGRGVNKLADNMVEIVSNVQSALAEVHRSAQEISQSNANLAQRTEQQSASLEETASSMEEMTSTVKQNADNAGQANQLAVAARDQAEKGGAVVAKAVSAMGGINDASRRIVDIIAVIDEIAFQTNLLALNAAVEAARAGEQGRGFAVVASEVRSLAGRSATAAKEIKDLIQDSVKKVEDGSVLVTQSGQTLEQIVASVKKVSDIVAEIAAASREQSSGIEQVNRAVMQMDELTQQNAALVEEATNASRAMARKASELNETMTRYTVAAGAERAAVPQEKRPGAVASSPASAPPRVERRKANRPWSGTAQKAQAVATAPATDEWQEF
jgi:methyl-accepting chemotaxis protein